MKTGKSSDTGVSVGTFEETTVRSGTDCCGLATTAGSDTVGKGAKVDTGVIDETEVDVATEVGVASEVGDDVWTSVGGADEEEVAIVRTDDVVGSAVVVVGLPLFLCRVPSSSLSDSASPSLALSLSSSRRTRAFRFSRLR